MNLGFLAAGAAGQLLAADKEALVFIGTYTRGGSKGIYSYRFNPSSGKLTEIGVAAEAQNPSFLTFRRTGNAFTRSAKRKRYRHRIRCRSGFGQADEAE